MDKKIAGLLGAAGCIALSAPTSYADLLNPIQNAVEVLRADNAAKSEVQQAAWMWNGYAWEWHGDEPYYRPRYHDHHHHHHNSYHDHHHHHHHHHGRWDD